MGGGVACVVHVVCGCGCVWGVWGVCAHVYDWTFYCLSDCLCVAIVCLHYLNELDSCYSTDKPRDSTLTRDYPLLVDNLILLLTHCTIQPLGN